MSIIVLYTLLKEKKVLWASLGISGCNGVLFVPLSNKENYIAGSTEIVDLISF